jgi:hypothetical protein
MKLKGITLIFAILIIVTSVTSLAVASWVKFTVNDLVQKSDVILLGKIVGPVGESKGVANGIDGWVTYWRVEVFYYLKGDQETKDFFVVTPGAKNKNTGTSNDYRLDEWGSNLVMLFLNKSGDTYVPMSPQGIVAIEETGYLPGSDEPVNGTRILAEFKISNPQTSPQEEEEFQHYINDSTPMIPTDIPAKLPLEIRSRSVSDNITVIAGHSKILVVAGCFIVSLVIILALLLRHKEGK